MDQPRYHNFVGCGSDHVEHIGRSQSLLGQPQPPQTTRKARGRHGQLRRTYPVLLCGVDDSNLYTRCMRDSTWRRASSGRNPVCADVL